MTERDGPIERWDHEELRRIVRTCMTIVDEDMERHGWDLPPAMFYLRPHANDGGGETLELTPVRTFVGDDHPADALVGTYAPDDVVVMIMATEAWSYPADATDVDLAVRPSQHPRRVEKRVIVAVGRHGLYEILNHVRGEERGHIDEEVSLPASGQRWLVTGRLNEAMRIHMRARPAYPVPTPQQGGLQAQLWQVAEAGHRTKARLGDLPSETHATESIAGAVVRSLLTGEPPQLPDGLQDLGDEVVATVERFRAGIPGEGVTWGDLRQSFIASLRESGEDPDLLRYYEWADPEGVAIEALVLSERYRGDVVLSVVPESMRGDVAALLEGIGMRCSPAAAGL